MGFQLYSFINSKESGESLAAFLFNGLSAVG